ncbi:OLC1v1019160C1 [Oldenlandia corymbosa var. corymbosa]|uniref:OLC1v1019160C1 n=1 Tax=Oldenlandia corymbosa var. corymbosa TaxID=529605 RepID=A0AAV1EDC9_OLDCO|nr:OLC1v1019160C1 [Oldenlandia corymbosa var. corymbosa]
MQPEVHSSSLKLSDRFDVLADLPGNEEPQNDLDEDNGNKNVDDDVEDEVFSEQLDKNLNTKVDLDNQIFDDTSLSSQTEFENDVLVHRGFVSDGEQEHKKRGRPRGSKKVTLLPGTETRRLTRLQGGSDQVIHIEASMPHLTERVLISAIYAKSSRNGRQDLWAEL